MIDFKYKYNDSLVSVIMPAHNAGETLDRAIESVLAQTYSDIELLVINDGSIDDTGDILLKYKHLACIKTFTNNTNQGVSGTRNVGLKSASGRYISFLDADDHWEPSKIEKQVNFLRCSDFGICFSQYWRVKGGVKKKVRPISRVDQKKLLIRNHIPNLTAIYDREKVPLVYQIDIPHEDYAMWYDLLRFSDAYCLDEPLASYTVSTRSISGNKFKAFLWNYNIKRKIFGMSTFRAIISIFIYFFASLKTRLFG